MTNDCSTSLDDWFTESEDAVTREEVLAGLRALRDVDDVRYFDSGGALDAAIALLAQPAAQQDAPGDHMAIEAVWYEKGWKAGAAQQDALCDYCHGVGACPKCWGRAAIEELKGKVAALEHAVADAPAAQQEADFRACVNCGADPDVAVSRIQPAAQQDALRAAAEHIVATYPCPESGCMGEPCFVCQLRAALAATPGRDQVGPHGIAAQQDALRTAEREWLAAYRAYEAGHTRTSYLRWVKATDALWAALADTEAKP